MIKDIKAAGDAVYILSDSDLYAMDNYCSTTKLSLVLQNVNYIDASPKGCIAIKNDKTIWYTGDSIDTIDGPVVSQFTDVTSYFNDIESFNISTAIIKKSYYGCMVLVPETKCIWSIGHNKSGELGTGLGTYNMFFDKFTKSGAVDVVDFCIGANCSFYRNSAGEIYGAGYNTGVIKASTTTPITRYTKVQWDSNEVYYSGGGMIYKNTNTYYALGNQSYGQLSTGYSSIVDSPQITPTEIKLNTNLKFSDIKLVDNNLFDNAFIGYGNNLLYVSGNILGTIYPIISTLNIDGLSTIVPTLIAYNTDAIFVSDGKDVYYYGLIDNSIKKSFTKINLGKDTSFGIYNGICTANTVVLSSINKDVAFNTITNKTNDDYYLYNNNNVYFCANLLNESASFKVLYDETVWYSGSGSIIGSNVDTTDWVECTHLFQQRHEVRDNLLSCKFQLTRSGILILTPLGNIYALGTSYNSDLGVKTGVSGIYETKHIYSKLTKTAARNAVLMGNNYEFTFYLNSKNELFLTGNINGLEKLTPNEEEDHSTPGDDAVDPHDNTAVIIGDGFNKASFWNPAWKYISTRTNNFIVLKDNDLWGYGWDWRYTMGLGGPMNMKKKIPLPSGVTYNDIQIFSDECSASADYSIFMTKSGEFCVTGVFDIGLSTKMYKAFTKVPELKLPTYIKPQDVIHLSNTNETIILCTNTQDVYYFGKNSDVIDPQATTSVSVWTKLFQPIPVSKIVFEYPTPLIMVNSMVNQPPPPVKILPSNASGYTLKYECVNGTFPLASDSGILSIPYRTPNNCGLKITATNNNGTSVSSNDIIFNIIDVSLYNKMAQSDNYNIPVGGSGSWQEIPDKSIGDLTLYPFYYYMKSYEDKKIVNTPDNPVLPMKYKFGKYGNTDIIVSPLSGTGTATIRGQLYYGNVKIGSSTPYFNYFHIVDSKK